MAALLGLPVEVPRPVGLAVVLQLQRVAAGKDLRRPHKTVQRLLILLQDLHVVSPWRIAGHDEQYGDGIWVAAGCLAVIGQVLKHQPLIEGAEHGAHVPQIVGCAYDQPVGLPDGVQHRRQPVATDAVPFELFLFAAEAGDASSELFQPIEVKAFDNCSGFLRPSGGVRNQRVGINMIPTEKPGVSSHEIHSHDQKASIRNGIPEVGGNILHLMDLLALNG